MMQPSNKMSILDEESDEGDFFDIDIIKNQAFDKTTMPYKFEFSAIEPEPSFDSAFDI